MMKDPEVLDKAANLIEKKGLANGIRKDESGSFCALGALNQAKFQDPWSWEYPDNVLRRLCTMLGLNWHGEGGEATAVADWSNNQDDKKVVVSAFRKLARKLRVEGDRTIS